ncbi:SOS response-associated peptidase [Geomonas subterranea]|uniref:SOS response-associated peptidase n=1 Tax=Geomonas subterranea TaxID=2847989 RepID=UPI001CD36F86|nr:SOS response-associated peptidase [Geomonas fuzhouensis]
MCGRFTAHFSSDELAMVYGVDPLTVGAPRYNICPTQQILAVRQGQSGNRAASSLRWGLVPHWAKDLSVGAKMTNARSETVAEKPAFRHAIKTRRCIIPSSGWYEWATVAGRKIPHYLA